MIIEFPIPGPSAIVPQLEPLVGTKPTVIGLLSC